MISVIESGIGNVGSILNMLKHLGIEAQVIRSDAEIRSAERLVLPGVGAFDPAMSQLKRLGFIEALNYAVQERRRPILGICLGMQLLLESSEEGEMPGLGWINGRSVRFKFETEHNKLPVPNMGWNEVAAKRTSLLFGGIAPGARYYFVHSYHAKCHDPAAVAATATYGAPFTAAVEQANVFGVQFHPEKSHRFGMALLYSFSHLDVP